MGFFKLRTIYLSCCVLELIITIERQVFDFLGYMWTPIFANFLNIIFIIFGIFGGFQYVSKYVLSYAVWSLLWLGWNIFLICFYLNIGDLDRESGVLSLGTGSVSWWEANGWGCQAKWDDPDNVSNPGEGTWLRPIRVEGCLVHWAQVEVVQSALGAVFAALGGLLAIALTFYIKKNPPPLSTPKTTLQRPLYTIELSKTEPLHHESALKPMTPRRVKRRSVSRGPGGSTRRSRRSNHSHHNNAYQGSSASFTDVRPTSAHSSYSNFHPARPASYHCEQSPRHSPIPPIGFVTTSRATPQAPHRTPPAPPPLAPNGGPPAYHLHCSNSLDTFMWHIRVYLLLYSISIIQTRVPIFACSFSFIHMILY